MSVKFPLVLLLHQLILHDLLVRHCCIGFPHRLVVDSILLLEESHCTVGIVHARKVVVYHLTLRLFLLQDLRHLIVVYFSSHSRLYVVHLIEDRLGPQEIV